MKVDMLQLSSQWANFTGEKGPKNYWGFFWLTLEALGSPYQAATFHQKVSPKSFGQKKKCLAFIESNTGEENSWSSGSSVPRSDWKDPHWEGMSDISPFTWTWLICFLQGQVEKSYLPTRQEQEVEEFRKLHREKSFDEARTAVQSQVHWKQTNKLKTQTNKCSQIERMFLKAAAYLLGCRMSWRPGAHHNRCTTRKCHQELFEAVICISSKISVSSFRFSEIGSSPKMSLLATRASPPVIYKFKSSNLFSTSLTNLKL